MIIVAGYRYYTRLLNFRKLREIAEEVGASFMVDMAHFAGLVAGKVLVGDFEGTVLVARLTVCQSGDMCPAEQTYTVLGFYNEDEKAVVAHVRLSPGCQSTAVQKSGRFVLVSMDKEAGEGLPGGSGAGSDASGKRGSRTVEAAKQASQRGDQFYKQSKYSEAAAQFKQSLEYDPGENNWPAYLGRGSSLLKLGKVNDAIKDLEKARAFNPNHGPVLYMLGCAYAQKRDKKQAMEHLRTVVHNAIDLVTITPDGKIVR